MCDSHEVKDGLIVSPGKFEGEPMYMTEFWDRALNGDGEVTARIPETTQFRIGKEDEARHPEWLTEGDRLYIWEDGNGFVRHVLIKQRRTVMKFDVEFWGGVLIGVVIGVVICVGMTAAWAATTGTLWNWTVMKDREVVCTAPYVWADLKLIDCDRG